MEKGALSRNEIDFELARNNVEIHVIVNGYIEQELFEFMESTIGTFTPGKIIRLVSALETIAKELHANAKQSVLEYGLAEDDGVKFTHIPGDNWWTPNPEKVKELFPRRSHPQLYHRPFPDGDLKIDLPK